MGTSIFSGVSIIVSLLIEPVIIKGIHYVYTRITAIAGSLLVASMAFSATPLQLPAQLPELTVTAATVLGSNEEGIGLKKGEVVTDFAVHTHDGKPIAMNDLLTADNSLLVVFYRGGWCPYCNRQIRQLTEAWPEFEKRKITPVLISVRP